MKDWLTFRKRTQLMLVLTMSFCFRWETRAGPDAAREAHEFLAMYNPVFQQLTAAAERASWLANTEVSDEHTGQRIGAEQAKAAFTGNTYVIEKASELLKHRGQLDSLTVRQLERIMLIAAEGPGTIPQVVAARVAAEARLAAMQNGFTFKLALPGLLVHHGAS